MAPSRDRLKTWLKFLFSIGLSVLFLYLAVSNLGGCPDGSTCEAGQCVGEACGEACPSCIVWSELPAQIAKLSMVTLGLYILAFLAIHVFRIWRWYFLLRPLGLKEFGPALNAGAIGLAAIIIVPLRLGELVRPYLISRDTDIPMTAALGTAVVERVVDGLSVTLILFIGLLLVPTQTQEPGFVWTAGTISAGVFGTVMTVLLLSWWKREATSRVLRRIGEPISKGLTDKALRLLDGFLDGVASLRAGGDLYYFLLFTFFYWLFNGASLALLANGFGIELTVWEGYTVMAILVIGIMVPGGPGHVGTFEFFLQAGLGLYIAVETMPDKVVAFIATLHVVQFLIQLVVGIPFWLKDGLSLKKAISGEDPVEQ